MPCQRKKKQTNKQKKKQKKTTADNILKYSEYPKETVCMKCQTIFLKERKYTKIQKKNIITLSSVEFALGMIKIRTEGIS